MPYVKQEIRDEFKDFGVPLKILQRRPGNSSGDLNYLVTMLIQAYLTSPGKRNYQGMNDIVGALDGAKAEFQRRVVIPYEEEKIKENGDCYI